MAEPAAQPDRPPAGGRSFPRPPAHAWAWFQRSRPVVAEAASRLAGGDPGPDFVTRLRRDFVRDPFVRDMVIDVVAEVAFNGRVPQRRPVGATWDRGLVWWAAAIAGATPSEFEARSAAPGAEELRLFDPSSPGTDERARLAARLGDLLAAGDGDQVPASAIRQLLAELEGR